MVGLGRNVDRIVIVIPAVVGNRPRCGPGLVHDVETLLKATLALPNRYAKMVEVINMIAHAHAHDEATARQNINHGGLLGQMDRVIQGRHDDVGADLDALGTGGQRSHEGQSRGKHAFRAGVSFRHEQGVKAGLFRLLGLVQ